MTENPFTSLFRYGVDAPGFVASTSALGAACALTAAARPFRGRAAVAALGAGLLAQAGIHLHTTLRGKLRVWERELDALELRGDERLLDVGCGRGAVLIGAARRLPRGRAVGVDLWATKDQSGNTPAATLANATAAGVRDRIEVHTADVTELPFPEADFDLVTSALVIHNIPTAAARLRAVDEALRVLRPGGRLLLADISPMVRRYAAHLGAGTVRPLGPAYWYGGPWLSVSMLELRKPEGLRG
ncbi:class I SAM-dependent methyltransferase [Kitasatospora phosalacinea]|uniref:class I SAM-dependent methyltransferase n=1 Tax=Kitasatospora phosalacinea TaxID=2065 RepID=UPI000523FBF2|nr:class I SAM-dependent methyltransferase [Kitasatospora phosalacinea]